MTYTIPHQLRRHRLTLALLSSALFATPALAISEDAKVVLDCYLPMVNTAST